MSTAVLLSAVLLIPFAGAAAIFALRRTPNRREAASIVTALILVVLVTTLMKAATFSTAPVLEVFEIVPGIPIAFQVEPLGAAFALVVAILWLVTIVYSIGYMRVKGEAHQTRFYLFFALAIAATVGGAFAENLMTLFVYYELLTLATYPLVTHGGKEKDRAGGHTYIILLLGTSTVFLLLAIAWTYTLTGTLSFQEGGIFMADDELIESVSPALLAFIFALFLFGTGKAALMPFHRWLPAAMVAPTPVSALLHAVAVVKLGVFAVLKISLYIFGLDALTLFDATWAMQYVAAATLIIAAVYAVREDNLKRRLAYSTISQLAYVVLAATIANQMALAAGVMHIAAHAFAKITLFFCAGIILLSLHKSKVSELQGIGRHMPITMSMWIIASLCVIGLPLTGGFWSKWYLAHSAWTTGQPFFLLVILAGSLLAAAYLLPPAVRAFYSTPRGASATTSATAVPEAPRTSLVAVTATALVTVLLFFVAQPVLQYLDRLQF